MNARNRLPTFLQVCLVLGIASPAVAAGDAMAWDGETYVLSVREMVILQDINTDDTWSPSPDLFVRIVRKDQKVSDEIARLHQANGRLESRHRSLKSQRDMLQERKEKSEEVASVEPLTAVQVDRLETLSREVGLICESAGRICRGCPEEQDFETCYACAKCPELELLQWREDQSERVPPEPLTESQLRRLESLREEVAEFAREMKATRAQITRLRGLIRSSSSKIETSSLSVDFGPKDVIRVYPDDEINVSVWDDDVFNDDLYGRATVTLDRTILEKGSLDVSMPNIKFVRLKFRRDERVAPAE